MLKKKRKKKRLLLFSGVLVFLFYIGKLLAYIASFGVFSFTIDPNKILSCFLKRFFVNQRVFRGVFYI